MLKRVQKLGALGLIMALALGIMATPVQAGTHKPASQENFNFYNRVLDYDLDYSADTNEMVFTVTNNSYWPLKLTIPSGKKFDLAVLDKNGRTVWRYSDGKQYTQALQTEWLMPWRSITYKAELPELQAGKYTVLASYHAQGINKVVAAKEINVQKKKQVNLGLTFSSSYSGGKQPHLVFAVRNLTKHNITVNFPTAQKYDVVIKGNNGYYWRLSQGKHYAQSEHSETIKAGVNRFYFIYIPDLPAGKYTASIYYPGVSAYKPVTTTTFTVR